MRSRPAFASTVCSTASAALSAEPVADEFSSVSTSVVNTSATSRENCTAL